MTDLLDHIAYITALDVPPDAVLCIKSARRLTAEHARLLEAEIQRVLPGRPVLILSPDLELVVVRDVQEVGV